MTIGQMIRTTRERKVLGQNELARKAGISINTLYRIEAGMHKPRPATIRKIAEALGIPPEELVTSDNTAA
ncbi:MAG: helix-turn-helix domain-containing protein [Chloroflexota bacterium]